MSQKVLICSIIVGHWSLILSHFFIYYLLGKKLVKMLNMQINCWFLIHPTFSILNGKKYYIFGIRSRDGSKDVTCHVHFFLHLVSSCWNFGQTLGNLQLEYFFYPLPNFTPKVHLAWWCSSSSVRLKYCVETSFQVFHRTFASFTKLKSLTIFFFTGKIDGRNSSLSSTYSFSD